MTKKNLEHGKYILICDNCGHTYTPLPTDYKKGVS